MAAEPALQALFSKVPGISTKNVGADLASAWDELFAQTGSSAEKVTGSAIQYINDIPTTGPAATLLQEGFAAVYQSVIAKESVYISQAIIGAGLGSLASGFAKATGGAGEAANSTEASGIAKPTGAAGTRSRATELASSTEAPKTTAAPTSSQASTEPSTNSQSSTTQQQQPSPSSSSSTAGAASQPTAGLMVAGAAAAGVLGFAALL